VTLTERKKQNSNQPLLYPTSHAKIQIAIPHYCPAIELGMTAAKQPLKPHHRQSLATLQRQLYDDTQMKIKIHSPIY